MIRVTYFIVCLLLGITLVSCIRDEALNAEADILTCTVPGDILKRDPIIENNKVVLMVTADADLTHQAPEFTLTPGATISPASGTERDFTTPQFYTVTSEDGNWKKEYQVTYIIAGISSEYHFENVKDYKSSLLKYVYNIFYENDLNPAKRKAMVAKNEKRFLKQKRNVLQKSESLSFRSDYPVKIQASFKRLLKAV